MQDLEIVRGTTNAFSIALTDAQGRPYILEAGQVLVFGIKEKKTDEERLLVKKFQNHADGEYYLELAAADTADIPPGRKFYDVGLQQGDSVFYNVIRTSNFTLLPNVTQLGDGS